jgi:hypothetical protein
MYLIVLVCGRAQVVGIDERHVLSCLIEVAMLTMQPMRNKEQNDHLTLEALLIFMSPS